MNQLFPPAKLPILVTAAGLIGMALRFWLLADGTDPEGLLIASHPANIFCWILTALTVILLLLGTYRLLSAAKYEFNFPASVFGGIGAAGAALGILTSALSSLIGGADILNLTAGILGFLSVGSLAYVGFCRWKGQRFSVIFHATVCLYLMVFLLCQYRHWSANPQLQDYCFQLLAGVCLLISTYHRACFDANMGSRKSHGLFRLLGAYFCLLAIPGSDHFFFYLTGALWSLSDLCSLVPMPRHRSRG